jgi:hypothetical protein
MRKQMRPISRMRNLYRRRTGVGPKPEQMVSSLNDSTKPKGRKLNNENRFIIRYGLHNFVNFDKAPEKRAFVINGMEGRKMINHAKRLIKGAYGETTPIEFM